jgi:Leucine-rich repeat (LRR) protein
MKSFLKAFSVILLIFSCSKDEPIIQYEISTQATPADGGSISPANGKFDDGDVITFSAIPSADYKFKEWTGSASGSNNPLTLTINSNKSITAVFEKKDDDNDGVSNDLDKCSNTPIGQAVDSNGCSTSQKDTDLDGIMDNVDTCPNTPIGQTVNSFGCSSSQTDSDVDGVMDNLDQCQFTPIGAIVDNNGCTIPMTYVPDDNFEKYLISRNLDDVLDDYVMTANIVNVTYLSIAKEYVQGINNLIGIEDFKNLEILEVTRQNLTEIDVSKNIALKKIDLWENNIIYLDITKNINLTELIVSDNKISSLDISKNTSLIELSAGGNKLTSLDISKNTSLIKLSIFDNQLTSLNLTKNIALRHLSVSRNLLSEIDISNNNDLYWLYCNDNKINNLDLSNKNNLRELWCNTNKLTSLDVSNIKSLTELYTYENQISCIKVNEGQLLNNIKSTKWVSDSNVSYSTDCNNPNADKTYVPDNNFEQALINLGYDDVIDDYVFTPNIYGITFLNLNNKNISDLTGIEDFVSLVQLYAQSNNLTSIDITNNTNLESLLLDENNLTSIDLSTLNNLFALTCMMNDLTTINTSNNPSLYTLVCSYNKITTLDLSQNSRLDTFYCDNNALTSLDVSKNNNLNDSTGQNQFNCQNNPLQCIKINQTQLNNIPDNWEKDAEDDYSTNCN